LRIILEALKIDKMPKARLVHLWFALLFILAATAYMTMPEGGQLDHFNEQMASFLQRKAALPFPPAIWFSVLLRQAGLILASSWFILLYAVHWLFASSDIVGEVVLSQGTMAIPPMTKTKDRSPTRVALKAYPTLLLLAAASILPYVLSIPLMGIPFFVFSSMFSMAIFVRTFENKGIPSAMEASFQMTMGMKFFIFVSFMFLQSITSMAASLLQMVFARSLWAGSLIRAFFFALNTLAFGRMAALFYRSLSARGALTAPGPLDGN